jgi:hypothetical protein
MSYVSNEIRDKIMEKVLAEPSNRLCFDCNSKEPKWSSPYLGIILCYDCAARHRSYGTHISFVRSVDLDKWNKKQLKSIEISGNSYTKERFNELGIPKIGNIYDYNNDLVLKYRAELAEKVKEELENEENNNEKKEEKKEEKKNEENENVNINNEIELNNNNNEVEEVKNEIEKPTKFEINKNVKLNNIKIEGKGGKKNKIKKVDFDFNFDSFDTMNFSDFNKKEEEDENDNKMTLKEQLEKESKKQKEENKKIYGNTKSYDFKYSEEEINKKFANKKAISSEDYAALEDDGSNDNMIKNKIKSMGNSQAISSEDIYGRSDDYAEETFGDKLKDFAINFTLKAAEKAKEYKNKANEYINKMQNKLGGSG